MKFIKTGLLFIGSFLSSLLAMSQMPGAGANTMDFSSVSSYEVYAEDESTWSTLRSLANQSTTLTTIAEYEQIGEFADTLCPDFLKEVLNTDYVFKIGSYLIKIDFINDRGLIIDFENSNAYADLVNNNLSAPGMMELEGEEDFGLELLEKLEEKLVSPSDYRQFLTERRCKGASRETQKAIEGWATTGEPCDIGNSGTLGRTYGMDNKTVYQKAIFYFSLQSKIRSVWRCTYGGSWTMAPINTYVDLKLAGTVKYRKRCETEINDNTELFEGFYSGGDGILHWRPYSGGRSLSHYDFHVDFGIRPAQDRVVNPPPYIPSNHYHIVSGY